MLWVVLYVIGVVAGTMALCHAWKKDFGSVTVGDLLLLLTVSSIYAGAASMLFYAFWLLTDCKLLKKELF